MNYHDQLECNIDCVQEKNYSYIDVKVKQGDILQTYFLFDTLVSKFNKKIMLYDRGKKVSTVFTLNSDDDLISKKDEIALTENNIDYIKKSYMIVYAMNICVLGYMQIFRFTIMIQQWIFVYTLPVELE